jgi:hypothetical protein
MWPDWTLPWSSAALCNEALFCLEKESWWQCGVRSPEGTSWSGDLASAFRTRGGGWGGCVLVGRGLWWSQEILHWLGSTQICKWLLDLPKHRPELIPPTKVVASYTKESPLPSSPRSSNPWAMLTLITDCFLLYFCTFGLLPALSVFLCLSGSVCLSLTHTYTHIE